MPSYTPSPEASQPACALLPRGILAVTLFCFLKSDCPALPTSWPEQREALLCVQVRTESLACPRVSSLHLSTG